MRPLIISLLFLLSTSCATAFSRAECTLHDGQSWVEIESEHFTLTTNVDMEKANETVQFLEWTRTALLGMWASRFNPPTRVEVILLRNRLQWSEFGDPGYIGQMVPLIPRPLIILVGELAGTDLEQQHKTVAHELTHYLSHFIFVRQSKWVNEGFAQFMQTVNKGEDDQTVVFGRPDVNALKYLRQRRPPLRVGELWEWDTLHLEGEALYHYYASSWAWFYYLYNYHLKQFGQFWNALAVGHEPREAWNEAFAGVDESELFRKLRRYLREGKYVTISYPIKNQTAETTQKPLTPVEVHLVRAALLRIGHGQSGNSDEKTIQKIKTEFETALKIDPNQAESRIALSYLLADPQERLAETQQIVETYPDNGDAAKALVDVLKEVNETEKIEESLIRANQLEPEDPGILRDLAFLRSNTGDHTQAIKFIEKAVALAPWESSILATYALIAARAGACEEARALVQRAHLTLREEAPPEVREKLQEMLAPVDETCPQQ